MPFVAAVREEHEERAGLALAVDLSAGGMCLRRVSAPPSPKTPRLRLEFELPDGPISVDAELSFERQDGGFVATGVRFVRLGDEEAMRLQSFIADHVEVAPRVAASA